MRYQIEVSKQGRLVARHIVEAANALAAINLVETCYGPPVEVELGLIEDGRGRRRPVMVVNDWHGYMFDARAIQPAPPDREAGQLDRVVVSKDDTTLVGGHGSETAIKGRISQLKAEIEQATSDHDQEKLQERLAKLAGGVAIIRVGAAKLAGR